MIIVIKGIVAFLISNHQSKKMPKKVTTAIEDLQSGESIHSIDYKQIAAAPT